MRKLILALLPVIALTAGLPGEAGAGFIGFYDVANWTTTLKGNPPGGGGSVDTSGAPNIVTLVGGNNGCISQFSVACTLSFTIPFVGPFTLFPPNPGPFAPGNDTGQLPPNPGNVIGVVPPPSIGVASFHWAYQTTDVDGPLFDRFGQTVNGTFTQLSSNAGANSQSGDASIALMAGSLFGFEIDCTDCILGPATATISNFEVVSPVPEPGTLLLFGSSLVGLAGVARRWHRK